MLVATGQAAKCGAAGVDFDVVFTSVRIPVLIRDGTVDVMTDGSGQCVI